MKHILRILITCCIYTVLSAQQSNTFDAVNAALRNAFEKSKQPVSVAPVTPQQRQQPVAPLLHDLDALKSGKRVTALRNQQPPAQAQALDTLIVGLVPNDTVIITGTWTHTGPIWVFNDGVLIFHNATVHDTGDVYVFGNGQLWADSSSLFFPQQYFYERVMVAVENGYIGISNSSMHYSGLSHSLVSGGNAIVQWNNVHQNDWTTCGLYGSGQVHINGCNLTGEYILNDTSTTTFQHADSIILWHQFPETAVVNYAFPNGSSVNNYTFSNSTPGVSGIDYQTYVDSCNTVWWAIMPVNGSDVTLSNSDIRLVGAWFERGDTASAYGIFNNSAYVNYTAPLADRNLQLNNSTVGTWSFYVFDSSAVAIDSCVLGEVGTQQRSLVTANNTMVDGSGGYFWATDSSLTIASNSISLPTCRSEREALFIVGYCFMPFTAPTAVAQSTLICVQDDLFADPVPYDASVAWLATMEQPDTSVVNSMIPVTGSAWIDQGPLGNPVDFAEYSMYWQLPSQSQTWFPIVQNVTSEVSHNLLGTWNTNSLQPGTYILKLMLRANTGDSVEGYKVVELLPNPVGITDQPAVHNAFLYPNPSAGMVTLELHQLSGPATLHIYNNLGALVKTVPVQSSRTRLDLSDLPEGMYGWSLQGAGGKGILFLQH